MVMTLIKKRSGIYFFVVIHAQILVEPTDEEVHMQKSWTKVAMPVVQI